MGETLALRVSVDSESWTLNCLEVHSCRSFVVQVSTGTGEAAGVDLWKVPDESFRGPYGLPVDPGFPDSQQHTQIAGLLLVTLNVGSMARNTYTVPGEYIRQTISLSLIASRNIGLFNLLRVFCARLLRASRRLSFTKYLPFFGTFKDTMMSNSLTYHAEIGMPSAFRHPARHPGAYTPDHNRSLTRVGAVLRLNASACGPCS